MIIKRLFFVALLSTTSVTHACINAVGTDHAGRRYDSLDSVGKEQVAEMMQPLAKRYWLRDAPKLIKQARAKPDFENLTNLGIVLVYQGKYGSASRHFLAIERLFPGRHETAANLGTAMELAGDDRVALKWIGIGIQRNQEEHDRSEWLHARILQAKIALAKDPNDLKERSVAGVAFEKTLVPPLPKTMPSGNNGKPVQPWELNRSLSYQLHERLGFVRPTDPVVANLLLDWATLNLAGGPVETADAIYDLAATYGAKRDALMRNRQGYIKRVLAQTVRSAPDGYLCGICQPMTPPPPPQPTKS